MQDDSASANGRKPSLERRLATILMADVVGYSKMMGEDEERTIEVLRGHREIFDEMLKLHRGRNARLERMAKRSLCQTEGAGNRIRADHRAPILEPLLGFFWRAKGCLRVLYDETAIFDSCDNDPDRIQHPQRS